MLEGVAVLDGVLQPAREARVSVFDRGFLYGDGVFEVLRTHRGEPFAFEEHLGRMQRAAQQLGLPWAAPPARWLSEARDATRALGSPEAVLRFVLTRGPAPPGLDVSLARTPTRLVLAQAFRAPPTELYTRGVAVAVLRSALGLRPFGTAGAKSCNYLGSILALRWAREERGAYEVFHVDPATGCVTEAASASVFAWLDGELRTPSLEAGQLAGITRARALDAAASLGWSVREGPLREAELWSAEELFLTSAVREVIPVVAVDEHRVGEGRPGARTRELHRALRRGTALVAEPMPWELP